MASFGVTLAQMQTEDIMKQLDNIGKGIEHMKNFDKYVDELDEKDDLYAKLVQAVPSRDYGKWADIRYRFLCSEYPESVQNLIGSGEIYEALEIIQNEYQDKYFKMLHELEKRDYDEYYSLTNPLDQVAMQRNWDMEITEILIDELSQ